VSVFICIQTSKKHIVLFDPMYKGEVHGRTGHEGPEGGLEVLLYSLL
jgi:hypothetical protein